MGRRSSLARHFVCAVLTLSTSWLGARVVHAGPPPDADADADPAGDAAGGADGETGADPDEGAKGVTLSMEDLANLEIPQYNTATVVLADPVAQIFALPPASKTNSYGPRPDGVKTLSRDQIVAFGLENPYVKAADENIVAFEALLSRVKFAWVPVIRTSAAISPGVNVVCDDVTLTQDDGDPFSFQYCRPPNENADIQTVGGYFQQLASAGVYIRLRADFVIPIYTFGKGIAAKKLAKEGVAVAKLQKSATEQETVARVYEAHAGLLLARESIRILEDAWNVVQKERVKIEDDLGSGFDADPEDFNPDRDPDDLLRLEVGEIELAVLMREARKVESLALAALWVIAGPAAPEGFDIAETELRLDVVDGGLNPVAEYKERAVENRPEAKMADALVRARKAQESLARSNFLPNIGIAVGLNYGFANADGRTVPALYYTNRFNTSSITAALAVSWNLDFHNKAFDLKRARAQKRQAIHQNQAAKALLGLEVEQAFNDLTDARDDAGFMAQARDKSWQLVVSQQQKGSVGEADFKDLQKALRSWAEYQFKHFEAIQTHNVALAKLSRSVGEPLVQPRDARPAAAAPAAPAEAETGPAGPQQVPTGTSAPSARHARPRLDGGIPPVRPSPATRPVAGLGRSR